MSQRLVFTRASDIEEHLTSRLALITVENGYNTDIGLARVYRGKRKIDDAQVPCAVLLTGEDTVSDTAADGRDVKVQQDFVLGGYSECDPDNPNDMAHKIVKDIKKAIWSEGQRLGFKVQKLEYLGKDIGPRADGVPIVFAVVHIRVSFAENLLDA